MNAQTAVLSAHSHCPNCGVSLLLSDEPGDIFLCLCDVPIQGQRNGARALNHTWGDAFAHCWQCHHVWQAHPAREEESVPEPDKQPARSPPAKRPSLGAVDL